MGRLLKTFVRSIVASPYGTGSQLNHVQITGDFHGKLMISQLVMHL